MNLSNSKLFSVVIALLGSVWCIGIFAVSGHVDPNLQFIGGIVGGILAVVVSIVYLLQFRQSPGKQATEVGALSIYFTAVYVVAALVVNTVLILLGYGGFNTILWFGNILIAVVYIVLILYVEKDTHRLKEQLERTAQKTVASIDISALLGRILAEVEDEGLRGQLLKLKETVDYSSNITTSGTFAAERAMEIQLNELEAMISERRDPSEILSKIREAETTWKTRSSTSALGR